MDKQNESRITYKQGLTREEVKNYTRAIAVPILIFLLALIVISNFEAFGRNIIAPAVSVMWIAGVIVAWKIPSQRENTLKQAYVAVSGYMLALSMFKILIGIAANTSSEQLMASYSQAMPVSTSSTIAGFLQSMLWITSFMTPITFLGLMGKTFVSFRRTISKDKVLKRTRGIREE